jgi:hypothetical protein
MDVKTLRQLKPDHWKDKTDLFAPGKVTRWQLDFTHEGMFRTGTRIFAGQNPSRDATIDFVLAQKADKISLKLFDVQGNQVRELDLGKEKDAGFHRVAWNLLGGGGGKGGKFAGKGAGKGKGDKGAGKMPAGGPEAIVSPQTYRIVLEVDGTPYARTITVEPDPRSGRLGVAADEAEELRKMMKERP